MSHREKKGKGGSSAPPVRAAGTLGAPPRSGVSRPASAHQARARQKDVLGAAKGSKRVAARVTNRDPAIPLTGAFFIKDTGAAQPSSVRRWSSSLGSARSRSDDHQVGAAARGLRPLMDTLNSAGDPLHGQGRGGPDLGRSGHRCPVRPCRLPDRRGSWTPRTRATVRRRVTPTSPHPITCGPTVSSLHGCSAIG